jgi:hypothetical protein
MMAGWLQIVYKRAIGGYYMAISFDSKVKDIMACPEAVAILEEFTPGISKNPAIKMIYGMPLRVAANIPQAGFSPERLVEIEERINALGK